MKIVTTETITNTTILDVKGTVFSEQVISVNIVKDALSGIRGLFGGKSSAYSNEYAEARKTALTELKNKSSSLDANAILSLKVNYEQFINSDILLIIVTAYGTAVTIESIY
ncbi:YbjQ family protein [Enterococcus sp. AZ192]|uniref:YbjQ family protein n=1 Tax=unclassified Enterococcus TaxID=2608891 RepID=UPI003D2E6764